MVGGRDISRDHGEAALRGVDADLTKNFETLANDVREIVENFGEVAAGLALEHDGGDKKFYVDERDALGEIDERVADGKPEFLLFIELAEFSRDRLGEFVGNQFEGGGKGVAGADGAGEGVDGLGKFLFKFLKALGAHV